VLAQLRERFGIEWRGVFSKPLAEAATFEDAIELAHLIDGYKVLEQLCQVDHSGWMARMADLARSGQFSNDLGILWTQLFIEHRRWRFASPHEPDTDELVYLDQLVTSLQTELRRELSREAA
jgi:hypothetical protein